jgi:alpha-galactosidase
VNTATRAAADTESRHTWLTDVFDASGRPPFSFDLDGTPWNPDERMDQGAIDDASISFRGIAEGLDAWTEGCVYDDFPVVEWTLNLANHGDQDSALISDIQSLDTMIPLPTGANVTLHHHTGSVCRADDYRPMETPIAPGGSTRIATRGGRPSDLALPYFNVEWSADGESRGMILAIGWPGQWVARFERDSNGNLRLRTGQELTSFRLHPGEEVRTPRIALLFWKGDRTDSQNLWRRWMLAHNMPGSPANLPRPQFVACSSHQYYEMTGADEASQKMFIDRYIEEDLKLDSWWMDAGWYPCGGEWHLTGTWEPDPERFPNGLRSITDHGHERGVGSILWFEPERVVNGTWLQTEHPEWLLQGDSDNNVLDLGNDDALNWLIDHVDRVITEEGIDLYRQDFNMEPLSYWRRNDAPDRQGITEIRHVTGVLRYWDELQRRHPGMVIDSCASGGRRNDIDFMKRSVPLHRSDYILEMHGMQSQTHGLSSWIPYQGTAVNAIDPCAFRSVMGASINSVVDLRDESLDYDLMRTLLEQWREVRDCFLGDFYPLTPYRLSHDGWIAWQFDLPEKGEGMIQTFRGEDNGVATRRIKLVRLDPTRRYHVTDADGAFDVVMSGEELMGVGVEISLDAPAAALVSYRASD